ncbi:LOW QUALITY PROTEIN: MICAL-like protein 1 [Salvelinus namaycush]|uniref:LOW QUALITY PROTEIN: MICAL-like protein 1 n=1 Tax=Salvelinus namaycush TaxID=8040 RepID=A0A8U0QK27_SALNM|nr:LOW QUALITY PROTEIN: MICAL-like protein 1 [Salvelinus namaycush]
MAHHLYHVVLFCFCSRDFNSLSKDNVYENKHLVFEVAQSKLSIPALLDAKDMVSTEVPDRLSVITYLSHYYHCFNKKSHASPDSLKTPCVAECSSHSKTQPDSLGGLQPAKSRTEERSNSGRPCSICASCTKHVHLVQRHLTGGKLYHRSCFRCSVCSSTLLPGSYKEGSEVGSLVCTHHLTASQNAHPDYSKQTGSIENLPKLDEQEVTLSQGGYPISLILLEKQTQVRQLFLEEERQRQREVRERQGMTHLRSKGHPVPKPTVEEGKLEEAGTRPIQTTETLTVTPDSGSASASPGRPAPAPRRVLDSTPPRPAPRTHPPKAMDSPLVSVYPVDNKTLPNPSRRFGQPSGPCKPKDPPWLELVQPGPWPKLPPAPPPSMPKPPHSGSIPSLRGSWYRVREPPPNPFGEFEDEEADDDYTGEDNTVSGAEGQAQPSMVTSQTWCGTSQLAEATSSHCQAHLEDTSREVDKSSIAGVDDAVNLPEIANAPKVESLAEAGCSLPVSNLAEEPCSIGISESADVGGIANMAEAAGGLDVCNLADVGVGESTNLSKAASSLGLSNLTEAKTTSSSYLAQAASSLDVSNLAEVARSHGVSGLAGASGLGGLVGAISAPNISNLTEEASSYGVSEASAGSLSVSNLAGVDSICSVTGAPSALGKSDIAQSLSLPKSVSVPAFSTSSACTRSHPPPTLSTNGAAASPSLLRPPSLPSVSEVSDSGQVPTPSPKIQNIVCKENPFNRKVSPSEFPKSKPAPGHGFPLIKRKVQTDNYVPVEELQVELEKRMDRLELRGVEMERSLRDCQNDQEEEDMLVDWFTLIREKQMLVRRDAELVYMAKQQNLEERQADVEYELRCLLNKPECKWSKDDRYRDQQLMKELVTIIEQRNHIINSLDQDRQREKEEDVLFSMIKKKDLKKRVWERPEDVKSKVQAREDAES